MILYLIELRKRLYYVNAFLKSLFFYPHHVVFYVIENHIRGFPQNYKPLACVCRYSHTFIVGFMGKLKKKLGILTSCLEYNRRHARLAVLFRGNCQVWTVRISKTLVYEIVYVCIWLNSKRRPSADDGFYIIRSIVAKHYVFKIIWEVNIHRNTYIYSGRNDFK